MKTSSILLAVLGVVGLSTTRAIADVPSSVNRDEFRCLWAWLANGYASQLAARTGKQVELVASLDDSPLVIKVGTLQPLPKMPGEPRVLHYLVTLERRGRKTFFVAVRYLNPFGPDLSEESWNIEQQGRKLEAATMRVEPEKVLAPPVSDAPL